MKDRYRLVRRGKRYYACDTQTLQRVSLRTKDIYKAKRLLAAKNQAHEQPILNNAIAKVHLAAQDPELVRRTWQQVADAYSSKGVLSTKTRVRRAFKTPSFRLLFSLKLADTSISQIEAVLQTGGSSTQNYLRRLHNLALRKGWLVQPLIHPADWPKIRPVPRRAVTAEEHQRILAAENDHERAIYYAMLWETGGAQSDIAALGWENVDRHAGMLVYHRMKTGEKCQLRIGKALWALLEEVPPDGDFFPKLRTIESKHRSAEFSRRCRVVGIKGISLHCYRYAWAERACSAGYPERFAQAALGHKSKAIHRAYARKADVICPALDEPEQWIGPDSLRLLQRSFGRET